HACHNDHADPPAETAKAESPGSTPITGASPPLRTGPPARQRDGTQSLASSARLGRSLSPPVPPDGRVVAGLPTFRARAAGQAHLPSVPDTTWPGVRVPARLIPERHWTPRF